LVLVPDEQLRKELGGIPERTAIRLREKGEDNWPPYIRIGRRIFYRRSDVETWKARRTYAHRAAEAVAAA
jgi:hypothetical protein